MSTQKKAIALFSDGTGNTTNKGRGTNVFKVYKALDLSGKSSASAKQQITFYNNSVNSKKNKLLKVLSNAFG